MALKYADRVQETTTTTGTGTVTLAGASTGYQSFAAIGDGNTCVYCIELGAEWEVGVGTYTASGTTLSRDTVIASSNSGSLVSFSAGTKKVYVTKAARNMDSRMSDDGLVVAHETIFAGMSTQSFTNGQTPTLNGVTWNVTIANSATMAIVTDGLKVTYPTTGEAFFATNSLTQFGTWLGKSRLRRGTWAVWTRVHSWNFAALALGYVVGIANNNYPEWSWGTFRARNTAGAPNNANGSFTAWGRFNGAEVNSAYSAAHSTEGTSTTVQNDASDVCCMYFRSPYNCDFYYGTWSSGWPTFESLSWGASIILPPALGTAFVDYRDPATVWRMYLASGSGGNNTSNNMTIYGFRVTYWDP